LSIDRLDPAMSTAPVRLPLGWSEMSFRPVRPSPAELVRSVADEMALIPCAPEMLHRLRRDHDPDRHGWCSHPTHAYRWERHPCATLRLADLVEGKVASPVIEVRGLFGVAEHAEAASA